MRKILFLSGLDFKEKSIQVIRKTPEAYVKAGWQVDYVVARDNLENGNYSYEEVINPEGVMIYRMLWPFSKLRARIWRIFSLILNKFSAIVVIFRLAIRARKLLKNNAYDVVYGYEMHGVLAMNLIRFYCPTETKFVSRFQGTFLNEMFVNKQYLRILFNADLILAIWLKSDLLIMTNDGTQGEQAVKKIKGKKCYKMVFWVNGVDRILDSDCSVPTLEKNARKIFLSVSRLVSWKKVDRNLKVLFQLKNMGFDDFIYYVVGEGEQKEKLEELCNQLGLQDNVMFTGALKHSEVNGYLFKCNFFMSMYDSSNVGNPLLEAIRANKIIITLANGDTGSWIEHKENGLIYSPLNVDYYLIAKDIYALLCNDSLQDKILENIRLTEAERLWSWEDRMKIELDCVSQL